MMSVSNRRWTIASSIGLTLIGGLGLVTHIWGNQSWGFQCLGVKTEHYRLLRAPPLVESLKDSDPPGPTETNTIIDEHNRYQIQDQNKSLNRLQTICQLSLTGKCSSKEVMLSEV